MADWRKLPRRAVHRIALTAGIVVINLGLVFTIGVTGPDQATPAAGRSAEPGTPPKPKPYATVPPVGPAAPPDDPDSSDQAALEQWSKRISAAAGIPTGAAMAYGRAEMWMRSKSPGCHISWTSLAALGSFASEHGGVAGDGLGPMQIPPTTWQRWASAASGDGSAPAPNSLADSALTVARLLCAQDVDLRTPNGWWTAVESYTQSIANAQQVFSTAKRFALATG